jgi:hypothetical protein
VPVTPERLILIRELANDEGVDRLDTSGFTDADWKRLSDEMDEEAMTFCRDCADPEELHAFVRAWNWDKGFWAIAEIIRNPACEAATALMAYWTAGPEWYLPYADRDAVAALGSEYLEGFDLITEIETRYVVGDFSTGCIAYDPNAPGEFMVGIYNDRRDTFVRALPEIMYRAVP